jgi:hypothetical protein
MTKTINLAEELSEHDPAPYPDIPGAYIYHDQTPSHQFTTVVAPILEGEYCVVLSSRDCFDEGLATTALTFVLNLYSTLYVRKPLIIIEGFSCQGYSFDSVAILSPSAANQYEHENALLNKRVFVAFPIYRCELAGNESNDLIDLIRHDFLPSLDWKRSPCPKVLMSFHNAKTKVSSTGIRPRLTTVQDVLAEIENLFGAEGSWIKLENYRGQRCRIEWTKDIYSADFPDQRAIRVDKAALVERVKRFLCPQLG